MTLKASPSDSSRVARNLAPRKQSSCRVGSLDTVLSRTKSLSACSSSLSSCCTSLSVVLHSPGALLAMRALFVAPAFQKPQFQQSQPSSIPARLTMMLDTCRLCLIAPNILTMCELPPRRIWLVLHTRCRMEDREQGIIRPWRGG